MKKESPHTSDTVNLPIRGHFRTEIGENDQEDLGKYNKGPIGRRRQIRINSFDDYEENDEEHIKAIQPGRFFYPGGRRRHSTII